ncbi:MAG: glutathione S-transferase family protein [Casimicrobiaceae bacterium]
MLDLILHHYPTSPFSEKIRLILGYKELRWKSVVIPVIMPKPDVIALTGGYRKTPILQIGSDVYCDTALIADVLEELQPTPTLYPQDTGSAARVLAQWADSTLFWTMIPYTMQPAGLQSLFANVPGESLQAFAADRRTFRAGAARMPLEEATSALILYLDRLEGMLRDEPSWLVGDTATLADFSVYHSLWFIRRVSAVASPLERYPRLREWAERVKAIGHGRSEELSSSDAVAIAQRGEHAATANLPVQDFHGIALGERVAIAASDYGMDPVEGTLVISAANEIAVRRTDPRAGEVIVHFPRIGFQLNRVG